MNNYHSNIKLTVEVNPSQFLDTEIMIKNGIIETSAVVKESKIPNHWSSAAPKKYKRNAILGDLHRVHIKFQVISNLKNSVWSKNKNKKVKVKNILALISHTVLFSLLLIFISKSVNR